MNLDTLKINPDSDTLSHWVVQQLSDKKAENVSVLDLRQQKAFTDFMVVASGTSSRHLGFMAEYLKREAKSQCSNIHVEDGPDWTLVDLGDVIVHLFKPETRELYAIEKMWSLD
jgi:ribosome-associated protein